MNVVRAQRINRNQKNAGTLCLLRFRLARGPGANRQMAAEENEKDPHGNERITVRVFDSWSRRLLLPFKMLVASTRTYHARIPRTQPLTYC